MAGPQFVKYFKYVLSALKELGNSGRPAEVREVIAQKLGLSDDELNDQMGSGASRFENQVAWARFYLSKAGYLDSSKRGVWRLTEKGINSSLTDSEALKIFQQVQQSFKGSTSDTNDSLENIEGKTAPPDSDLSSSGDYQTELLEIIRNLSPAGFERLCQRLLREAGFQQVEVIGRSRDGGIDGKGILQINSFLSIQAIFQAKRYSANAPVTASQIRDFRGAMSGRTDKGIFITTSYFTTEAEKEAFREGTHPIELVGAKKLVDMFVQFELGLTPKTVYEVDRDFFKEFA